MNKIKWREEASKIKELSLQGKTLQEIGFLYGGFSREFIRQILFRYYPELSKKERGQALITKQKKELYTKELYKRTGRLTGQHETDLSRAIAQCYTRKKQNAKTSKWGWELSPSDLVYPTHCPYLGIELDWFAEYMSDNSPSFDRINTKKGYVLGNVIICSWRANRIKSDGTAEEHRKIADYLDKVRT